MDPNMERRTQYQAGAPQTDAPPPECYNPPCRPARYDAPRQPQGNGPSDCSGWYCPQIHSRRAADQPEQRQANQGAPQNDAPPPECYNPPCNRSARYDAPRQPQGNGPSDCSGWYCPPIPPRRAADQPEQRQANQGAPTDCGPNMPPGPQNENRLRGNVWSLGPFLGDDKTAPRN